MVCKKLITWCESSFSLRNKQSFLSSESCLASWWISGALWNAPLLYNLFNDGMFGTWSCAGDILNTLGFYHKGKRTAQYLKQWSLALERQYRRRDSSLKQNTSKRGVSWVLTAKDNTSHLSSEPKERTLLRRKNWHIQNRNACYLRWK